MSFYAICEVTAVPYSTHLMPNSINHLLSCIILCHVCNLSLVTNITQDLALGGVKRFHFSHELLMNILNDEKSLVDKVNEPHRRMHKMSYAFIFYVRLEVMISVRFEAKCKENNQIK